MYYEVLADRVHYFKEDEKGVAIMCKAMEDMKMCIRDRSYSAMN